MLIRQLIKLPVGKCRERQTDEVLEVKAGIRDILAIVGHEIGKRSADDVVIAGMRADEVGIVHPEIVNRFPGLDFHLDLVDQLALVEQFVTDLNARDVGEGLRENLQFVIVDAQNFRHGAEFETFERLRSLDEPFHLGHLLVFGQRRWLKFAIDPFLCCIELLGVGWGGGDYRCPT